jgi:hypothetical protein
MDRVESSWRLGAASSGGGGGGWAGFSLRYRCVNPRIEEVCPLIPSRVRILPVREDVWIRSWDSDRFWILKTSQMSSVAGPNFIGCRKAFFDS